MGDRTGTDSEPRSLRIEPYGERMGAEWGPGPFTIEQTTEDVHVDPPLGREQAPRATATRATGSRLGHRAATRRRLAPRSVTRAERAIRTAPEPGHLKEEARSEQTEAGGALGRRANRTGAPA